MILLDDSECLIKYIIVVDYNSRSSIIHILPTNTPEVVSSIMAKVEMGRDDFLPFGFSLAMFIS